MALPSTLDQWLREYYATSVTEMFSDDSPLVGVLRRELEKKAEADRVYLAGLTPQERVYHELMLRITRFENRYRSWWEQHMAWRFKADAPDAYDW